MLKYRKTNTTAENRVFPNAARTIRHQALPNAIVGLVCAALPALAGAHDSGLEPDTCPAFPSPDTPSVPELLVNAAMDLTSSAWNTTYSYLQNVPGNVLAAYESFKEYEAREDFWAYEPQTKTLDEQQATNEADTPNAAEQPTEQQNPLAVMASAATVGAALATRKPPVLPDAGAYNSNAWTANTMFQSSLNDRLSSYSMGEAGDRQGNAWIRYSGARNRLKDNSGTLRTSGDKNIVMMGVDLLAQSRTQHDQYSIGVMGGYGHYTGRTRSDSLTSISTGKVDGYGVGLYGTYQQDAATQQGLYADSWLLWNKFDDTVKNGRLPHERYDAKGVTASVELGYHQKLAERDNVQYLVQPRVQAIYQNVRSDSFYQADGSRVEFLNRSRMQTTVGLRASAHIPTGLTSSATPYMEANWLHTTRGYGVRINNVGAEMDSGRNTGQLKLGITGTPNRQVSLNVDLFHNHGNRGYRETGGNLIAQYRY